MLNPASPEGETVLRLFWFVLAIAAAVFLSVAVLVGISVVRFRHRPGDPVPKQVMGDERVEILWTAVPFAILVVLFGVTVSAMHSIQPPVRSREPDLDVVAHQWWWEGHYRRTGVVVANEFHFAAGQTLLLRFRSGDVIHSWWVPRLGRKMDIFPNHLPYDLTPWRPTRARPDPRWQPPDPRSDGDPHPQWRLQHARLWCHPAGGRGQRAGSVPAVPPLSQ